ncbi:MFS transporter [Saccharopolyspora rosea]|uniref:CynX/NimT family MFS transporter n=1 Tax=Saccharopolyspora rosea TaxID=524884 RepID=A0ABW3G066_9PSEU
MSEESRTQHVPDHVAAQDATRTAVDRHPDGYTAENSGAAEPIGPHRAVAGGALLLTGVALAAANMRPAVTSLASVLGEVRDSLGASSTWASVLTSVPTLCFGVAGIAAPLLARKMGINRVVGVALAVLTAAMAGRMVDGPWTVLGGTVLVCAAIAMCNVLIPVVVKESFPERVGMATAIYTTAMAAGGSAGSALTPWLDTGTGSWRLTLATWAVLALAAFLVWVPATARRASARQVTGTTSGGARRSLLRSPLAWAVTCYFAFQSLVAYVVMGWLPEVFKGAGMDGSTAGVLLGVLLLIGVPISMVLPPLVTRTRSQSWWAVGLAALNVTGMLGVLFAPLSMPWVWAVLIGVGMSAFPLALVLISLRTANAADTSRLSAMAQSIGYLIASFGPFLFGTLHDLTGAWSASLVAVVVVIVVQGLIGIVAGRPRTV